MSSKENPWLFPERASSLIPPQATAGSFFLRHPPDPHSTFNFQFPSFASTVASSSLTKKQISLRKEIAPLVTGSGDNSIPSLSTTTKSTTQTPETTGSGSGNNTISEVTIHDSFKVTGIPQVTVPEEVFLRGAEMHKEFVLGSFLAKMPSYQSIQSVLNFMWGKGHKMEIRTNQKERKIMAHLKGLPLDPRGLEGLNFAAGLIGEPKETDEFTKNLTDLNVAHVKIEANLTTPLPALIDLRRTTGKVYPVEVKYPWVPPSCSFCHQIDPPEPAPTSQTDASMANQQPEVENTPTAEENQQIEFETDLQEIFSPPTIQSPPKSMEKDTIIPTTPSSPPSYSNPSPFPVPFPSSPQDSSLQDLISFNNSPSVASVIVGLAAIPPRRHFPFKHKPF
ncbi:hypothetical protein F2Q69_00005900 [Brassica cretica]|uniref:DUF4283 domain-containing protein n=1 Tax=Brassica cretica TaxID=69181 RepID=A0A8S9NLC1_BRACR|nr:hypothetical protein F2Q69_00005900 [Brassica cretica]